VKVKDRLQRLAVDGWSKLQTLPHKTILDAVFVKAMPHKTI